MAAICRLYGPKLDKIPPPFDVSIPAEITESVRKVEPILRAEAAAMRRLEPPRELRAQLARWNELNRRSIAKLGEALRAAKKTDLRGIQVAYVAVRRDRRQGPEARSRDRIPVPALLGRAPAVEAS